MSTPKKNSGKPLPQFDVWLPTDNGVEKTLVDPCAARTGGHKLACMDLAYTSLLSDGFTKNASHIHTSLFSFSDTELDTYYACFLKQYTVD